MRHCETWLGYHTKAWSSEVWLGSPQWARALWSQSWWRDVPSWGLQYVAIAHACVSDWHRLAQCSLITFRDWLRQLEHPIDFGGKVIDHFMTLWLPKRMWRFQKTKITSDITGWLGMSLDRTCRILIRLMQKRREQNLLAVAKHYTFAGVPHYWFWEVPASDARQKAMDWCHFPYFLLFFGTGTTPQGNQWQPYIKEGTKTRCCSTFDVK